MAVGVYSWWSRLASAGGGLVRPLARLLSQGQHFVAVQFVIATDQTRIAYDVTGHGPALMLLHGAGKSRQDWHTLGYVQRLQNDFTVISVDIRGSGESDPRYDIPDYTIDKICSDIHAVADACRIRHFAIWGFSFGGNIARYVGAWSERVTAIAVIGVPFGPAVDEEFDRYIDEFVNKWQPLVHAQHPGTVSQQERAALTQGRIPVWLACFQAMRDWPSIEPSDVKCPTLLLVGSRNKHVVDWATANREALDRAQTRVAIVEGLTHSQEFSEVDRVFPVVAAFFHDGGTQSAV